MPMVISLDRNPTGIAEMDLKEEQALGEGVAQHWYYRSKSAALLKLVAPLQPRKVLDVGAGSGFFSKYLLSHTQAKAAWCIDPYYAEESDDSHVGKPIYYRHECGGTDADLVLDDGIGTHLHVVGKLGTAGDNGGGVALMLCHRDVTRTVG